MQQKLLRKAGLLGVVATALGFFIAGCVDEPTPPVAPPVTSSVRFVHAVFGAPAVDIWVDSLKVFSNVSYSQNTPYKTDIKSGNRFIRLVPAGSDTASAVFRQLVSIRSFTKMTVVFVGDAADMGLLLTQERFTYSNETKKLADTAQVKLINTNLAGSAVKLVKDAVTGPTVIGAVDPFKLSSYTNVLGGAYKFFVVTSADEEVKEVNITLTGKTRYTFILVGDLASPEVLTLEDDKD